ncbi:MAG TPA: AlbA family DNA-binding domain-containing protein [Candidatus Tripitaka californicus]|uniref:AlbA family DNA-binding domain-containing protein n=1 Tax=Candidatus Tripitaka californicus TaxID=3367616 RepID=UPI004025BE6C|nr:ATP-binding protein [Planctomycetota bacterium]
MSIFTKPINDIKYEDVIDFCEKDQMPEGSFLEYKEDFPPDNEKLAKTIAAFANTQGGVLLIGVDERDGRPIPPYAGIQHRDKLYERVEDIIFGNIRPPVFCEIQVAPNSDKTKAFIVVRVPQSNDAHFLNKDRATYIRTGRSSHPEDVATPQHVEWLVDRRKRSVELREQIRFKAEERFLNACSLYSIGKEGLKGLCSVSIIPLYPQKPLATYQEVPKIIEKIKTQSNYFCTDYPFYFYEAKRVQGGISQFGKAEEAAKRFSFSHFWELNHFGFFLHKECIVAEIPNMLSVAGQEKPKIPEITKPKIISLICLSCKTALKFYRELGYWGVLRFQIRIENILGAIPPIGWAYRSDSCKVIDNDIQSSREFSFKELEDNLENIVTGILHEVFWSIGVQEEEKNIKDAIRKVEPL